MSGSVSILINGVSAGGLELYAQGKQAWALGDLTLARQLLEQACALMPAHGAAHHLLAKSLALLGDSGKAEALQRRSCELDPRLGWNWFALAEHLENRQLWAEASAAYQRAFELLPQESWIQQLAIHASQKDVLGGEDLSQGLGPQAYRHWCEQLEPRFPSSLQPVRQSWLVLRADDVPALLPPVDGWLVLLGPDYELKPRALQALEAWMDCGDVSGQSLQFLDQSRLIARRTEPQLPDLITADEERLSVDGQRCDPWFKPSVLAETFWSNPWLSGFSAWRCSWLRSKGIGPPPVEPEARVQWLWQSLSMQPCHGHVSSVILHQHEVDPANCSAILRVRQAEALQLMAFLHRRGERVTSVVPSQRQPYGYQIQWPMPKDKRCSAIVPTRNGADLLAKCLGSVEDTTRNEPVDLEWIIIDNGSDQGDLARLLDVWKEQIGSRMQVIYDCSYFNWSELNNSAAKLSEADLLLFLNNDIEALNPGWLSTMATQAFRSEVGCVGAQLLYPDGSLQHAGVVLGLHGCADHAYRKLRPDHSVHRSRNSHLSDWGAVTGAALMVERELFKSVAGFDTKLPVEFNDVDFCLRLGRLGYRHVIDPAAQLLHHESQSRDAQGSTTAQAALIRMQQRWGERMQSSAPWWPQACSNSFTDGRPRELGFVR